MANQIAKSAVASPRPAQRTGRSLVVAVWQALDDRHVFLIAAGVAFYSMFAIFPGIAATIAVWGTFADPMVVENTLMNIRGLLPEDVYSILQTQVHSVIASGINGWHLATILPLAISLYSVHSAVSALISGLNVVQVRNHRPTLWRIVTSLTVTLALLCVILIALGVVVAVPITLSYLHLGRAESTMVRFLPWMVLFIVVKIVLGMFYRFGANTGDVRHGWISTGSLVAALLWAIVSFAFSVYLENFGSYNRIYGSIGAVIALMSWLYLSALIVLLGAIVNTELRRLRAVRDGASEGRAQ